MSNKNNKIQHPLERYKLIADPTIRQQCIDNFDEEYYKNSKKYDDGGIEDAILYMCFWENTPQKTPYWSTVLEKIIRGTLEILPEPIEDNPTLGYKTSLASNKEEDIECIRLRERYRTLSELDAPANSKHKTHIKINQLMKETLNQILSYERQ
jgi:hypothetical protein